MAPSALHLPGRRHHSLPLGSVQPGGKVGVERRGGLRILGHEVHAAAALT